MTRETFHHVADLHQEEKLLSEALEEIEYRKDKGVSWTISSETFYYLQNVLTNYIGSRLEAIAKEVEAI